MKDNFLLISKKTNSARQHEDWIWTFYNDFQQLNIQSNPPLEQNNES